MALFPKIQGPCPYAGELSAVMDGEMCRKCDRAVFDLTEMEDEDRRLFMQGCSGRVCVSYKLPIGPVLAAVVAAGAIAMPLAAAAEDATEVEVVIVVGSIVDPAKVDYIGLPQMGPIPELPIVYEDEPRTAEG